MIKQIAVFLLFAILYSCTGSEFKASNKSVSSKDFYEVGDDSVKIAPFEIGISLSAKAEDRIRKGKETIIVAVYFNGSPKDSSTAEFEEDGSFFVASGRTEIQYGEVAILDNIKFSRKIYDQLVDKDIDLGVNVFSGRKSSPDNLLDCEPLFDKISNVAHRKFILKGKLIYGDD